MTIFSSELLGWNLLSSHLLIGAYYGILSTFPLAPSQLLSIRVLLLEDENTQGKIIGAGAAKGIFIAGVSGFLIAQFAMFLSIYSSSLYTVWFKPHLLNFFLPPFLLWHYFRIIEFDPVAHLIPNYKHPLFDPRVRTTFIESFLLQIINPMVLPNPVFTRLMSIFLFKYSHVPTFLFGSLIGWLSGQLLFVVLSWMLLSRLQLDSPAIYRIVKRIVHWAFPPIIMGIFLSYMGRVSMVPFYKKTPKKKYILSYQLWPDLFYNRDRTSRLTHFMLSSNQSKLRNQTNAPFNISNSSLHKNHFSQYFFSTCLSDGKSRLSHTYPVSLSLIQNDLKTIINLTHEPDLSEKQWNQRKEVRLLFLNNVLIKKINQLDNQCDSNLQKKLNSISDSTIKIHNFSQYIKKKITYSNELSQCIRKYINSHHSLTKRIRKSYDTRLGNDLRKQPNIIKNESPWLINQQQDFQIFPKKNRHYLTRWKVNNVRLNRLQKIAANLNIYTSYHDVYKKVPIWKSKARSLSFYYQFQFFKKNLTRRRRRKFFFRSFFLGATSGRCRNNAGTVFQFLEHQPRSLFFLRANEISIKNKENLNSTQRISQTESEKFDFSSSHSVRGPALITQAFIRKYIKLPTLILGKSFIRSLLMQSSEWEQDWMEWNREKYIYCYYNGNFVSNDQMPPHWLGDGLQIKILSPFHLTPWRLSLYNENPLLETKNPILPQSSYINIWGQETDVPFGEIQSTPFLKPIIKALILFWRYQLSKILKIYHRIYCNMKEKYFLTKSHFVKKIDTLHNQIDADKNISNNLDKKFYSASDSSQISINELQQVNSSFKEALLSEDNIIYNQNHTVIALKNSITDDKTNLVTHQLIENTNIHLEKVNDLDKINHDFIDHEIKHYNVPIFQRIKNKKHTLFPRQLIFTKKNQFIEYQKTKIKMYLIQLNQKYLLIKKLVFRAIIRMIRITKQKNLQLKQNVININIKLITSFNDYLFLIQRCLVNLFTKGMLLNIENHNYSTNNTSKNNNDLSHAYILHKIWQNNVPNRLSIKDVIMQWKGKNSLRDHIKMILMQYGFLQDKPEDINVNNLKEWLRPFRRYTPSPKIWYHISPNHWSNQVTELWNKNPLLIQKFQYRSNLMLDSSIKYLSYYKPVFEKNKQIFKRWQNSLLMNSYMNSVKNDHLIDLLSGWETKDRENNQLINLQLITENLNKKNNILISEKLTWGSTNTRNNSLVISFPLIKLFNKSLISKKKHFISKKQPIYFKYENTLGLEKNDLFFLKKRVSFRPIIQYRWKSEQDRFKVLNTIDILRKAKSDFKNAIQNAMLAKKHNLKSASVLADKAKEATVQWKTLNLSTFTCQCIKKRQAKILDDEILMHSIITSFLKFKNKYLSIKDTGILNSAENDLVFINQGLLTQYFLMPEDLLLVKTLREYRILSSFNFNGDSDINKTIHFLQVDDLTKNHTIKDTNTFSKFNHTEAFFKTSTQFNYNQTIQRYLWPSYRIEDLACMNRFWINTANQSRFSSLRIRIYPNLIV